MADTANDWPKKRPKLDYGYTITVSVGAEETPFVVHESTICRNSKFFKAACSDSWRRSETKRIRLADCEPDFFRAYIHWCYSGQLDVVDLNMKHGSKLPAYLDLGKMWILGDMLLDSELCNAATDQSLSKFLVCKKMAHIETLHYIWDHTRADSALRGLRVDLCAVAGSVGAFRRIAGKWPQEVLLEVAARYRYPGYDALEAPTWSERHKYHTLEQHHESGSMVRANPPGNDRSSTSHEETA